MEKDRTEKRWMNIEEAAAYSGYQVGTLYKKVERREFPFTRPPGTRRLKFDRLAIDKHLERYAVRAVIADKQEVLVVESLT